MAKIRFEDVSITAKAIELEGIEYPEQLLTSLGLRGAKVLENTDEPPIPTTREEREDVEANGELEDLMENLKKESPEFEQKYTEEDSTINYVDSNTSYVEDKRPSVADFSSAKRLRDILSIFVEQGVTSEEDIVHGCKLLKEDGQPLLKLVGDIEGRIPRAMKKWRETNM